MDHPQHLSTLQVDIAEVFFALREAQGYLVAGGAALLARDLIARPTADLDLFTATPAASVKPAKDAFVQALTQAGYDAVIIQDAPTFCRMIITQANQQTLVDLAIDSPPISAPTITVLGPTLAPLELAGRKLLSLFSRAEPRDFADVYVLAQRFGKHILVERARALDPGFDPTVLAQMIRTLDRLDNHEIPLTAQELSRARAFFTHWASELE